MPLNRMTMRIWVIAMLLLLGLMVAQVVFGEDDRRPLVTVSFAAVLACLVLFFLAYLKVHQEEKEFSYLLSFQS